MKISMSKGINIDLFCKNPIQILKKTDIGTIKILKNDIPVFYVVTPDFFHSVFCIDYIEKNKNIKKENILIQKFAMHDNWTPDEDFLKQAALWGIYFTEKVSTHELAYFISYWKAEGCFFHHIQWQQKLARSVQKSRSLGTIKNNKRDITYIPTPDQKTPIGFRGE